MSAWHEERRRHGHRSAPSGTRTATPRSRSSRILWAQLLARIYEVLPLLCPVCGGEMKIISFITLPSTVQRILLHLDSPHRPPRVSPARSSPRTLAPACLQPPIRTSFGPRLPWRLVHLGFGCLPPPPGLAAGPAIPHSSTACSARRRALPCLRPQEGVSMSYSSFADDDETMATAASQYCNGWTHDDPWGPI